MFTPFKIIFRRRGESELCADEILKDRAIIAADRAMRFVADDQLEIRRRELGQETIACGKALNCCHDYLRLFPFLPLLFVDDRLDSVVREVSLKISSKPDFPTPTDRRETECASRFPCGDKASRSRRSTVSCPCRLPFQKGTGPCHPPRRFAAHGSRRADNRAATEFSY